MNVVRGFALTLILMLSVPSASAQGIRTALTPRDILIEAHTIPHFLSTAPQTSRFGKLTFLGGVELKSKDPDFGGLSGLVIDPDGKSFIAITDRSHWVTGSFILQGEAITGITQARIAPMLAPNGRRLRESRYYDTEGLARQGRHVLVSVERNHAILRYEWEGQGFASRPSVVPTPPSLASLDKNSGIEAVGVLPPQSTLAGTIIAIAEQAPQQTDQQNLAKDIPGYLIGGRTTGFLRIKMRDEFAITDLSFLPNGDMLILERRFALLTGIAMRIRRIALASITPNALLDGEILIEADGRYALDNMEGMAMHQDAQGRTVLTLISDDNFSAFQRSLILRFRLE